MRLRAPAWLLACLAAGCIGGQTGESTAEPSDDHVPPPNACGPNGIVLDIDQVLPTGFSARDVLDRFTGEPIEVAAYVVPDELVQDESSTLTAQDLGPEQRLSVLVEYLGNDQI